jgi:hypothetical protein
MEDKIIAAFPAIAMALVFSAIGFEHLWLFSRQGGTPNLLIGLGMLAILPLYMLRCRRDWIRGLY